MSLLATENREQYETYNRGELAPDVLRAIESMGGSISGTKGSIIGRLRDSLPGATRRRINGALFWLSARRKALAYTEKREGGAIVRTYRCL